MANPLEPIDLGSIPDKRPLMDAAPPQPGTWDLGGKGANVVGRIADALATAGGYPAQYAPRLQQQQYSNALDQMQTDPAAGMLALEKVAPAEAARIQTQQRADQSLQAKREQAAQADFYSVLAKARDAGQPIGDVIDAYAQTPHGKVIFDQPGEIQQAKDLFAKAPELIDTLGGGPVTVSGAAAEHLGFAPGTVLQRGPDGFKVLQTSPAAGHQTELTPEEKQQHSLDPSQPWFWGKDGVPRLPQGYDPLSATMNGPSSNLTGEDFLATLPENMRTQVKALSEGRLAIPSGYTLSKPYWQKLLQLTAQYDPSFDQANAKTRYQTRKDFTSGKSAQTITSFNTLLGHLHTLQQRAQDLNNTSLPLANKAKNAYYTQTGDPRVTNFNTAKQAVVSEAVRAFRGSAGTLQEVEDWAKGVQPWGSNDQLNGSIQQIAELLASRVQSLGEQYSKGMGRSVDGINLLDKKAQKALVGMLGPVEGAALSDQVNQLSNPGVAGVPGQGGGTPAAQATTPKSPPMAPADMPVHTRVKQGGVTYEKQEDGSFKEVQ